MDCHYTEYKATESHLANEVAMDEVYPILDTARTTVT